MIISASRRTDIPAFYSEWFINRVKAGYCAVPNPFNRNQISYISLKPEDVEGIVFWTRNSAPLHKKLPELDQKELPYYFQLTLINNPKEIDPHSPPLDLALKNFKNLAEQIGPEKIIWRYDPILFSNITNRNYHIDKYNFIAEQLKGYTNHSVISFVDNYRKASKRLKDLEKKGINFFHSENLQHDHIKNFVLELVKAAKNNGMKIESCAETIDLSIYGVTAGKCIDDERVRRLFKWDPISKKDPVQREECGCVISKDIGMYDSCLFGCVYCYATQSFDTAKINHKEHQKDSPSLIGWHDAEQPQKEMKKRKFIQPLQGSLF